MASCLSRQQVHAFLADDLSPAEMAWASDHLNACDVCQAAADELADDQRLRQEYRDLTALADVAPAADSTGDVPETDSGAHASPPATGPTPPPASLGRYELREAISAGAFGEVWRAFDPLLGREVAIKMIRRDRQVGDADVLAFLAEGRKLAALKHSGIVIVFDVGYEDQRFYIVTELLSGGTLAGRMRKGKLLYAEAARQVALVARAAHAAHLKGLVHRDIKPSNIVIDEQGEPRLADFGLAISEDEQFEEGPSAVGTLPYMSPEQIAGRSHLVDSRSDIYSLGVVLYEALTGRLPFRASERSELRLFIEQKEPRPPRTIDDRIPPQLEQVCLKCLRKSPTERYTTAADVADALDRWRDSTIESASRTESTAQTLPATAPHLDRPPDRHSRRLSRWSLSVVAASVICGFAAVGIRQAMQKPPITGAAAVTGASVATDTPARRSPSPEGIMHRVHVVTTPKGARIVVYPLEERYGLPDGTRRVEAAARSPVDLELAPGTYLVVAALDNGRFHEVLRTVPVDQYAMPVQSYAHYQWRVRVGGDVEWYEIEIPAADVSEEMGLFTGASEFTLGDASSTEWPAHPRRIPAFRLDPHEVTVGEILHVRTGPPAGSLALSGGKYPPADYPIAAIWYDDALSFAEKTGKRLPTEAEYEFAATRGGAGKFPWGDDDARIGEWTFEAAGHPERDRIDAGGVSVYGLYSNVAEWTSSWASAYPPLLDYQPAFPKRAERTYIVRGGPVSVIQGVPDPHQLSVGPRQRVAEHDRAIEPGLGFRCARSERPRLEEKDLELIISP